MDMLEKGTVPILGCMGWDSEEFLHTARSGVQFMSCLFLEFFIVYFWIVVDWVAETADN